MSFLSPSFRASVRALLYKAIRQHTKPREMVLHALRLLLPLILLVMVYLAQRYGSPYQDYLAQQLTSWKFVPKKRMAKKIVKSFFEAGIDYAFGISMLTVALLSMPSSSGERVLDRVSGLRFLLRSNGLGNTAYWMATSLESYLVTALDLVVLLVGGHVLNVRMIQGTDVSISIMAVALLAGATVSFSFLLGQLTNSKRLAQMITLLLFLVTFFAAPTLNFFDQYYDSVSVNEPDEASKGVSGVIGWMLHTLLRRRNWVSHYMLVFPMFPAYSMFHNMASACLNECLGVTDEAGKDWGLLGNDWTLLGGLVVLEILFAWIVILVLDVSSTSQNFADQQPPDEEHKLLARIEDLEKNYGRLKALGGVSFNVEEGACVGLLGPNGAGKSTLCKVLTRQLAASSGTVRTYSKGDEQSVNSFMGVCPQDTVLMESLTVLDHLHFFARLRGTRGDVEEDALCDKFLKMVGLSDKAECTPEELSGGTRRKLSVCLALIASPGCIVLDEPTTGIDAMSRQHIWEFIQASLLTGCGALVTTHMLDEAEALCSKLVVIKAGKIAESGTTLSLKERYGTGYSLHVDFHPQDEEEVRRFVQSLVPPKFKDPTSTSLTGQMVFTVGKSGRTVGQLFITLDEQASKHKITRWGITQATLADAYNRIIAIGEKDKDA